MVESRGEADFAEESLSAYRLGELGAKDLERHVAVVPEIARQIDRGHAPGAELSLDAVSVGQRRRQFGERVGHCVPFVVGRESSWPLS